MLELSVSRQLRDFFLSVEMTVDDGEILLLTGKNGSGKSTVLNLIAGLLDPGCGYIRVCKIELFNSVSGINTPMEERRIGYIFQNAMVFPHLSVFDNIAYGLRAGGLGREITERKVDALLDIFHIGHLKNLKASRLSGGQKQLVVLGRTLAIDPVLLLLDEPFRALDHEVNKLVIDTLQDFVISRDIPCITVTHQVPDITRTNSRIMTMEEGNIIDP